MKKNIIVAFFLALAQGLYAQVVNKAKLDQFFDRLDEKNKAMGSLVMAKDGKVVYSRSIGYSQIKGAEKIPLSMNSRYRVGSVTKMLTAVMILQLAEEGKLKLTDPLNGFFPQIANADRITIGQILAHRSGIHDISEDPDFRVHRLDGMSREELLKMMTKTQPDFEPDAKFSYSNTGYQLLGLLIEKLAGKPYQEVLKERITANISLKDTYPAMGPVASAKNESYSYRYLRNWEQQPETHPSLLFGSGNIVSTPADLAKFIHALFGGKLISQASLNQMLAKDGYGMGMETYTFAGKTFYGHTGGIDNYGSYLLYAPDEKLAVAYTANAKVYPVGNIINGIMNIYFDKPFTVPAFETIEVGAEVLDTYVGIYALPDAPFKFTVTREGENLFVQMNNQPAIPLEAIAQNIFGIESAGITFEFVPAKNQMVQKRGGRERVFTREK